MAEKHPTLSERLLNLDIDLDNYYFKVAMWALSLLTATSAYLTLKSTAIYQHYSLSYFDRSPVVLVSIFIVHVSLYSLAFSTRGGYLLDLRRQRKPHWFARATSWLLEFNGIGLYMRNRKLMNNNSTMVFATTLAIFLLCFLRVVAPGFGRRLPIIAVIVATAASFEVDRMWALMPYTAAVVFAKNMFEVYDERHIVDP